MVIVIATLVLVILVGSLFLTSRSHTSGNSKARQPNAETRAPKVLTRSVVSLHNKRSDCWIIIKNKVYDVTSYVEEHPGGDAILAHAGDDSTEGFYGPQHGTGAFQLIEDFYVGDLEQ
ncbi:hypothetical protein NMG60_11005083 [Bertholletia excelsa]